LSINTPNSPVQIGQAGYGGTVPATGSNNIVDMTGLSTFTIAGTGGVGVGATVLRVGDYVPGTGNAGAGILKLAPTSTIITNVVEVGMSGRNNNANTGFLTHQLLLGSVANTINTDFL